jgi:leucyl/phenylalanyl-tRNA--protein transferase
MIQEELSPQLILNAYCAGAFPMAAHSRVDAEILFYRPTERAVFTGADFHIPQRFVRTIRQKIRNDSWVIRYPANVSEVMAACAENRDESWINPVLLDHYTQLAQAGFVHAIGVYVQDELIGGLYWVQIGPAVMAESMFSRVSGAGKFALVSFMAGLQARQKRDDKNTDWVDVQFINAHLEQFNPVLWRAEDYSAVLDSALSVLASDSLPASAFSFAASDFAAESVLLFLQLKTQIS